MFSQATAVCKFASFKQIKIVHIYKWIRCLTTDQKIPGSNPGGVVILLAKHS